MENGHRTVTSDAREANYMDKARKDQEDNLQGAPVPAAEQPLFRGALAIAAGEYLSRLDEPAKLKEAINQFGRARQELDGASASTGVATGRTLLLGELAVAQLGLGKIGCGRESLEEFRGDQIHSHIGTLRTENRGNHQLERGLVLQRGANFRIEFFQEGKDLPKTNLQVRSGEFGIRS